MFHDRLVQPPTSHVFSQHGGPLEVDLLISWSTRPVMTSINGWKSGNHWARSGSVVRHQGGYPNFSRHSCSFMHIHVCVCVCPESYVCVTESRLVINKKTFVAVQLENQSNSTYLIKCINCSHLENPIFSKDSNSTMWIHRTNCGPTVDYCQPWGRLMWSRFRAQSTTIFEQFRLICRYVTTRSCEMLSFGRLMSVWVGSKRTSKSEENMSDRLIW